MPLPTTTAGKLSLLDLDNVFDQGLPFQIVDVGDSVHLINSYSELLPVTLSPPAIPPVISICIELLGIVTKIEGGVRC